MTPRPTPLLGFREPTVKGADLRLPVLTAHGEWAELIATRRDWALAVRLLKPHLPDEGQGPGTRDQGPAAAAAVQTSCAGGAARVDRRCGPHTPPERVAAYEAVLAEWSTGRESLAIVCARHAIKPSSLNGWRAKYRPARAPVPKPSGRLL